MFCGFHLSNTHFSFYFVLTSTFIGRCCGVKRNNSNEKLEKWIMVSFYGDIHLRNVWNVRIVYCLLMIVKSSYWLLLNWFFFVWLGINLSNWNNCVINYSRVFSFWEKEMTDCDWSTVSFEWSKNISLKTLVKMILIQMMICSDWGLTRSRICQWRAMIGF